MRTWVVMEYPWYLTDQPGVYAAKISDGVALFTEQEAKAKVAETWDGLKIVDIAEKLPSLLRKVEEQARLANLELERVRKLIEKSGIGSK